MPNIIKDAAIVADSWITVEDIEIDNTSTLPTGDLILPLPVWQKLAHQLSDRNIGVWLNSSDLPELIKSECKTLPIIAINFPAFADGRGYSYAHVLRAQYNYEGELRAIGDVLLDQLFYMKRSGFNSFAMRADQNLEKCLQYFNEFTQPYQAAADQEEPSFITR